MRQSQRDFWNNPTEVIWNEIQHHPGLQDEVTPRYGNRHLFIHFFKDLIVFSECKIKIVLRNLFAESNFFLKKIFSRP